MMLIDVKVLVYAHRTDMPDHSAYRTKLENFINGQSANGISDIVFSGFLRIVTNPRVFKQPSRLDEAMLFVEQIRNRPNAVRLAPGPRHWSIFTHLCTTVGAKGNLIPDAFLAALAIESGSQCITTDRDFSRFPGLDWRHPLDS